jgi:spectinomycin phosphotransferase
MKDQMENLISKIESGYNLQLTNLKNAPRGFVAQTYFAQTQNGNIFIKIIPKGKFTTLIEQSSKAQNQLATHFKFIQSIISNKSGNLVEDWGDSIIVIYPKIEGVGVESNKVDKDALTDALTQIHRLKSLGVKLKSEDFDPLFEKYYHNLESILMGKKYSGVEKEFQEYLVHKYDIIKKTHFEWLEIKKQCQTRSKKNFCITHGDALGNTVVDKSGELWIVDWDDIMLAPKERDLWSIYGWKKSYDQLYYSYYLYQRFFDDLIDWLKGVFESDLSQKEKNEQMINCKKDCFEEWLIPEIIYFKSQL